LIAIKETPLELKQAPELWSGYISAAWQEKEFTEAFQSIDLKDEDLSIRSEKP
tara:strand:- start:373 stop:531 length:159 start_codon:yes stop_codon:yes gene_type:complete